MKVLSLFDGMSCGQIALDQLGIPVEKYYASEIDKYAIKVTQANFPKTIQVGDVCNLDPKDFKDVNLILFGSPCQGFSFAGKQLAFDDPRSKLFFEAVRLLKAIKPKYFLAENVRMKKEFLDIFTEQLSQCYAPEDVDNQFKNVLNEVSFDPIFINSSLVSAQSRQRYYWTNIPGIKQPEDRGIVLRDILETEPSNFTKMSDKFVKRNGNRNCMIDQNKEKASNLSAMEYVKNGRQGNYLACDDNGKPLVVGGALRARSKDKDGKHVDWKVTKPKQMLELRKDQKSNAVSTVAKDSVVAHDDLSWRKLTLLECERLQTVPDDYTNYVSNTQRYKMLGNGWTVEVIKHIYKNMEY